MKSVEIDFAKSGINKMKAPNTTKAPVENFEAVVVKSAQEITNAVSAVEGMKGLVEILRLVQ